jgi:hypothetical protein
VAQATNTSVNGWTVAKLAPTVRALMQAGSKLASGAFGATDQPSGGPTGQDSFRTENTYAGSFAAGTWDVAVPVIAVVAGGAQDGRIKFRIYRSANADGSSAVEITNGIQSASAVTNLATATPQTSSVVTASMAAATLTNEYIFLVIAWEITGAGGNNSADVLIREGSGSRVVTPNFTAVVSDSALDPMGMAGFFGA